MTDNSHDPVITSYAQAPTRTVTVAGTTYAYRELGPRGGVPVVFFVHLAATLDNWDPRIVDAIAQKRHVITFDQRGVGASTGTLPDTLEEAADHAYELISALGHDKVVGVTIKDIARRPSPGRTPRSSSSSTATRPARPRGRRSSSGPGAHHRP